MIVEHMEAYEVVLVIWSFLFALLGLQGLISIYLEGEVEEVGVHPVPQASWIVMTLLAGITVANVWSAWAFFQQLFQEGSPYTLGRLAALMAFTLAALVGLYRRFFIPDKVVAQQRDDGVPW